MRSRLQSNPVRQRALIVAAFVVLLGSLLTLITYHYQLWPFQQPSSTAALMEDNERQVSISTNKEAKTASQQSSPDIDSSKSTSEVPVADELVTEITSLSQDAGMVSYTAKITGTTSDGTCSATYANNMSRPITRTVPSSNQVCGPVSIPETEFTALGKWTLTLRFYTNNEQSVATKDIVIQ